MELCPFKDYLKTCNGSVLKESSDTVVLQKKKAFKTIKKANEIRGTSVIVKKGSIVHKTCRDSYTNKNNLKIIKKRKTENGSITITSTRSKVTPGFKYTTHCILCDNVVVYSNGKRHDDVYRVSSENCQTSLLDCCESRGSDEKWVKKVLPNILYAKDFPAKDVLYHKQCSTNFRIGKSMPIKYCSSDVKEVSNIGRPKDKK